ncbi:hypothetical protein HK097_006667, partial [Rhizophlyctis rosea]
TEEGAPAEEEEPDTPATKKPKLSDKEVKAIAWPEGITDEDVLAQTDIIIGDNDLATLSNKKIREALEKHYKMSLKEQKPKINMVIDEILTKRD